MRLQLWKAQLQRATAAEQTDQWHLSFLHRPKGNCMFCYDKKSNLAFEVALGNIWTKVCLQTSPSIEVHCSGNPLNHSAAATLGWPALMPRLLGRSVARVVAAKHPEYMAPVWGSHLSMEQLSFEMGTYCWPRAEDFLPLEIPTFALPFAIANRRTARGFDCLQGSDTILQKPIHAIKVVSNSRLKTQLRPTSEPCATSRCNFFAFFKTTL